ncbi:hypothetical protein VKT23_008003 [Stygiomarasmius scandens]|uniref:Heterokaryon incompatibility domain-containing protein n=1 Tax=Marasmiellus scandens TaxID=2682957 RepID=A0ABR1JJ11_9AGAR
MMVSRFHIPSLMDSSPESSPASFSNTSFMNRSLSRHPKNSWILNNPSLTKLYGSRPRRLINTSTLQLTDFDDGDTVPLYAILSHTWLPGQEVSLSEFKQPSGGTALKQGYWKIKNACEQALRDGLLYVWVDTCCIDQESPHDIVQNIRSMYVYYENAEVCYAYLVDTIAPHCYGSNWFKRGWTLQELIAPRGVVFFDREWTRVGSRRKLAGSIAEVTGIPRDILEGRASIHNVDYSTRISWAAGRRTSKPHDQVYCLLGLLDVYLEPNYDEDVRETFERFQKVLTDVHPEQNLASSWDSYSLLQLPQTYFNTYPRRLINTHTLQLVDFHEGDSIPPYAILSHRWIHGEEVIFREFADSRDEIKQKNGYAKIQGACRQARTDNLSYIWVDTCCIDQENHHDVVRNIRSMFGYYENTQVCYAYLVDAELGIGPGRQLDSSYHYRAILEGEWESSEWFKRGWTLQELIAPRQVVLFDRNWQRIGTRDQLAHSINAITAIPQAVLCGESTINDCPHFDRIFWAMGRKTSRPQDQAYCLMGLLGVSIDPDYSEDVKESFERLRKAILDVDPGQAYISFDSGDNFYDYLQGQHRVATLMQEFPIPALSTSYWVNQHDILQ